MTATRTVDYGTWNLLQLYKRKGSSIGLRTFKKGVLQVPASTFYVIIVTFFIPNIIVQGAGTVIVPVFPTTTFTTK